MSQGLAVLVCGANGFLGEAICEALAERGFVVVRGLRRPDPAAVERGDAVLCDFSNPLGADAESWALRLQALNLALAARPQPARLHGVANAAGILSDGADGYFEDVHARGPVALFSACEAVGARRVAQISALGAECGFTPYFETKRAADQFLMNSPLEWQIVRPSLVFGDRGASARLFRQLASLPLAALPDGGRQPLAPAHAGDVAEAVARLLEPSEPPGQIIEAVGSGATDLRETLAAYRAGMGFPKALAISVPAAAAGAAAAVCGLIPGSILSPASWSMLQGARAASPEGFARLLGRPPRGARDFFQDPKDARLWRQEALAAWRGPLFRAALAAVWLWTAWVSAFVYPKADSLAMLGAVGARGPLAELMLYGASALDCLFGVATLLRPGRRLWVAQMALIFGYSAAIAVALPAFLWHPFGPLLKNIPILAALAVLLAEEKRP